jgi:hypothetical protein
VSTEYTEWYDEVLPEVAGCPTELALNAIKQTAIRFCHRTRVWKEFVDLITVTATDEVYDIPTPRDAESVRILRGWYDGKELEILQEEQVNDMFPDDWTLQTGTPLYIMQTAPDCFYLVPRPEATVVDAVKLFVALKPTREATGLPSFVYERYLDSITHGVKARLFSMASVRWSNPSLASYYVGMFEEDIGNANVDAYKGFGKARPRVKPQFM